MEGPNTILFCGDIMPGGVLPYQEQYISKELLDIIKKPTIRIGTLEAAIGDNFAYDKDKMSGRCNIIYAREQDFYRLTEMGINVVSIANNHVFDLGYDGFLNTIKILNENGIKYCGAGRNIQEAKKPVILNIDHKSIAIYAYCMYGSKYIGLVPIASENTFGVNPLDIDSVIADIKYAKSKFDYVIIMPHWGKEYAMSPLDTCRKMAFKMIDAGADAVVGSHPHIVQPVIKYRGKNIAFSLGNFLFPDFYMTPPRPIWYPTSAKEIKDVKQIVGYPFPIEKPIIQVWNAYSRIGLALEFSIDNDSINVLDRHFVELSTENILHLFNVNKGYKIKLHLYTLVAKYNIFNRIYKVYTIVRKKLARKYT